MPPPVPRSRVLPRFPDAASHTTSSTISSQRPPPFFDRRFMRARKDESYERVGRMVVEQSDLLIAIWDGEPAAGRGGTTQIVEEALARHTPVVWLNASEPKDPCILRSDKAGKRQTHALDELKSIFEARFSDRGDNESGFNFSHAYFAEKQPNFDSGPDLPLHLPRSCRPRPPSHWVLARSDFREVVARRMGEDDCQLSWPA